MVFTSYENLFAPPPQEKKNGRGWGATLRVLTTAPDGEEIWEY